MKENVEENAFAPGVVLAQEDQLVSRLRQGDQGALEELIRQFGGKVYYLALQYTKNAQDAEEVLQDVFLKIFRRIDTFRSAARLSPWLYKIAVNTALMKLREQRKHRRDKTVSLEEWTAPSGSDHMPAEGSFDRLADEAPDARDQLIRKEKQHAVRSAVGQLPEIYRTVVGLRDIDGLSLEEIAEVLNISIPAVKSRLHRARLAIYKSVGKILPLDPQRPVFH
jgi:RNA polymerase sigma-70 factor (ECF subfamily)